MRKKIVFILVFAIIICIFILLLMQRWLNLMTYCTSEDEAVRLFKQNEQFFSKAALFLCDKHELIILRKNSDTTTVSEEIKGAFQIVFDNKMEYINLQNPGQIEFIFRTNPDTMVEYGIVYFEDGYSEENLPKYFNFIEDNWYSYSIAYT